MTIPTLLGTGGHLTGSVTYSGSYYSNIGLGRCAMFQPPFMTESYVGQTIRVAGTISYLSWGLDTAFAALTLTLRQNGSNSSLAISFDALLTGWLTDSTHSVSVSSGDVLDFAANVSSSTLYEGSFYCTSARFDATSGSAQLLVAVGSTSVSISPSTSQQFVNFLGTLGGGDGTEKDTQFQSLAAGTWQNMAGHIGSNCFSEGTTFHNRLNTGNGSMAFSVRADQTGTFEDVLHSDSVTVSDLLNYGLVATMSGGSGDIELDWIGGHFLASTTALCMIGGSEYMPERVAGDLSP